MKEFSSPLDSGKIRVFEISKDWSLVVRDSHVFTELPNLYRRYARRESIVRLLATHEMEKVIHTAMGTTQ